MDGWKAAWPLFRSVEQKIILGRRFVVEQGIIFVQRPGWPRYCIPRAKGPKWHKDFKRLNLDKREKARQRKVETKAGMKKGQKSLINKTGKGMNGNKTKRQQTINNKTGPLKEKLRDK